MKAFLRRFFPLFFGIFCLLALSACGECAEHTYGEPVIARAATETEEGEQHRTCTRCGDIKTEAIPKLPHTHKYVGEWSRDDIYHWHASTCGHSTEVDGKAEHTYGAWVVGREATEDVVGAKHRACTVCGAEESAEIAKLPHTHRYAGEWSSDDTYHWYASACGHATEISGKAEHTYENGVCTACGAEEPETPLPPHSHTYADEWSHDDTYHWHASTCGHSTEVDGKAEHTYGAWVVDRETTEDAVGAKHRACTACGTEESAEIAKLPHTHKFATVWSGDATHHWHASTCGHTTEVDGKAEHSYKNGICTVCGAKEAYTEDGLQYELSADGASYTVTGIDGAFAGCVEIPASHLGFPVTKIGKSAFESCQTLTAVKIPESIESIGENAFRLCKALERVTFAEGSRLSDIEKGAFGACGSLGEIDIPATVTRVGDGAFFGCTSLSAVRITSPEAFCTTDFGNYANPLLSAHKLYINGILATEVALPDGTSKIGARAFEGCKSLTGIVIPASVTGIGVGAFSGCENLRSAVLPTTLTRIENETFKNCKSLASVSLPEGVGVIGRSAFYECRNLTGITIPRGVSRIETDAFRGCYKLVEVINLSSLNIVAGKTKNGHVGCYAKQVIDSPEDSRLVTDATGCIFYDGEEAAYLVGYAGSDASLRLPEASPSGKSYELYRYAFYLCEELAEVSLPSAVTGIGANAFDGCFSLRSVTFGENSACRSIGASAFFRCRSLANFDLPTGVTEIGDSAFFRCESLTSIALPHGIETIGALTFEGCAGLTGIAIPEGVTSIGDSAFLRCAALTDVRLPASVTAIGANAFASCASLRSIAFAEDSSCRSIGKSAFEDCTSLTGIPIPRSVTSIGDSAFGGCTALTGIDFLGTEDEWRAIEKAAEWDKNTGDYTVRYAEEA